MEQNPPTVPLTLRPHWWNRNWKWFVPVGCLGTLPLFIAFVVSIALIVFSAVKATDVYKDALARARVNPSVIEMIGSPIKEGFLVSGNTNVNGASGEANLSIPISGPKGKGTIYVVANKSLGGWNYSGLIVEIEKTHERIDLLRSRAPANSPGPDRVQSPTKKLSVSAILFGILAGIVGIGAGLFLGFALGAALAAAFHVSKL